MKPVSLVILGLGAIGLAGCQTAVVHKPVSNRAETISAVSTVTQGLTNKPITEAQLKNLSIQVARDPQAQSALRSINTALSPEHTVKYCPEDGERFSAEVIWCPDHKVKLEWVE
jgi:hypothetical protein